SQIMRYLQEGSGWSRLALGLQTWQRPLQWGKNPGEEASNAKDEDWSSFFESLKSWGSPHLGASALGLSRSVEAARAEFAARAAEVLKVTSDARDPTTITPVVILGRAPSATVAAEITGSLTPPVFVPTTPA